MYEYQPDLGQGLASTPQQPLFPHQREKVMLMAKMWQGNKPSSCLPAPGSGISMDGASPVPFGCLKSAEGTPGPRAGLLDPLRDATSARAGV